MHGPAEGHVGVAALYFGKCSRYDMVADDLHRSNDSRPKERYTDMEWIRRTVASGNRLTDLHLSSFATVSHLYDGQDPTRLDTYRQRAELVRARFSSSQREALVKALRPYLQAIAASPAAMANLERLLDPQAVAVVTGQQAGLFGGPMYSLYKALSAIGLARRLEAELRCPVIPVFWVASEDHDWAEVNHAYLLDGADELHKVQLGVTVPPRQMVYHQPLPAAAVDEVLAAAHRLLAGGEYAVEAIRAVRDAFEPGMSLATWFARLLARLTAAYGLVLFDPCLPELRRLALPVWQTALAGHRNVDQALEQAYREVTELGVEPAVVRDTANTTLFYVQDGQRYVLERTDDDEVLQVRGLGVAKPVSEWLALAQDDPTRFSSNVLLRPVVQDTVLPTLAYIGGPAEIAYHALARGTFHAHGRTLPPLLLRQRVTLYPASVQRQMRHWQVSREQVWQPPHLVEAALADLGLEELEATLAEMKADSERRWHQWAQRHGSIGPQLHEMAQAQVRREWSEIDRLAGKARRLLEARHEARLRQLRHIERWLWTDGQLQERRLCPLNFWSRQGEAALRELPLWGDYDEPGAVYEVYLDS
jgi:bacillithiol biosynthesis cysteine-adding enzyme BshC